MKWTLNKLPHGCPRPLQSPIDAMTAISRGERETLFQGGLSVFVCPNARIFMKKYLLFCLMGPPAPYGSLHVCCPA